MSIFTPFAFLQDTPEKVTNYSFSLDPGFSGKTNSVSGTIESIAVAETSINNIPVIQNLNISVQYNVSGSDITLASGASIELIINVSNITSGNTDVTTNTVDRGTTGLLLNSMTIPAFSIDAESFVQVVLQIGVV